MQVCKYASIQVCKYASMQVYTWLYEKLSYNLMDKVKGIARSDVSSCARFSFTLFSEEAIENIGRGKLE